MPTVLRSYSKINLGLAVGPVRSDGYHGLATVYQTLALHDLLTIKAFRAQETQIRLIADHPGVPRTETGDAQRNTAFKIVELALSAMGIDAEVEISIAKRLPVQGGMGAGSANAAAALLGLEHELNVELTKEMRLRIAAEVGSDVPLFLVGGTVLGTGRGELVSELPDMPAAWCVMAIPAVGVSTALAFREIDARMAAGAAETDASLTSLPVVDKLEKLSRALSAVFMAVERGSGPSGILHPAHPETEMFPGPKPAKHGNLKSLAENTLLALVRTGIENDFEEVAFSQHPFLRDIKRQLMGGDSGRGSGDGAALYAALSGSGSALFGLYKDRADAEAAQHRVQQAGVQAILTETLPRREYWARMFAE